MDDLQFRRSLYEDPHVCDDAIIAAKSTDPAKQKFAQEIKLLDKKIAQAMKVPVPEELYAKLILRQTLVSHNQQKKKNRIHLALAASVAFAIGLTFNFMQFSKAYSNIGDYAIAHVNHEAKYFANNDEANISLASLNDKMTTFNGHFDNSLGKLIFADYCQFDGIKSLHLVFQGDTNPVTVFVIPQNNELKFNANFSSNELHGITQQFKNANIIVVGDEAEPLQKWQKSINKNIRWSI